MSETERTLKIEQEEAAKLLKRQQDKVRNRFEFLKNVSTKNFQAEYVKAQAEEICRYLKEMELTPLNAWYSRLRILVDDGDFMSQFYLTLNNYGIAEPDYERIKTLILPDPGPEDFPRGTKIILA